MLDFKDESGRLQLADAVTKLRCEIKLPESLRDFFKVSGLTQSTVSDKRRSARWKNRVVAGLLYRTTFPVLPRNEEWHPIYIKDVSRSGAAFLHGEQLYPLERVRILMIDDRSSRLLQNECLQTMKVIWCKRIEGNCFEIGAAFVD